MSDEPERPSAAADGGGDPVEDNDDAAREALGRARAAAKAKGLRPGSKRRRASGAASGRHGDEPSRLPYQPGRDPVPVGDTLGRLMAERGWATSVSVAGVVGRWREVVGDQVADHCRPETFEEGALVVRADSTAWAMQVRLLIPQLERRLAEEVGEGVVDSITVLGPAGPRWTRGPRSVPGRGPRDTYG